MKKISIAKILASVELLIEGYKNNTLLGHSTETCPLCYIYFNKTNDRCGKCLNKVFASHKNYSCVDRIREYDSLNWNDYTHKLDEFWTEVLEMLKGEKAKNIIAYSKDIQSKILTIAEKYR